MQQTTGVAVLATHLAATDRRALSEAWYSALHLAAVPATRCAAASRGGAAHIRAARDARASEQPPPRRPADFEPRRRPTVATHGREGRLECVPERRAPKSELGRRLERALLRRLPRATQTHFALSASGGRVHLLVRADGVRTRVVAVCAPALRERVERALAHARFALAARAVPCEAA
jgi:hypothetical protein